MMAGYLIMLMTERVSFVRQISSSMVKRLERRRLVK